MTTAQMEPSGPMSPGARSRLPLVLALIAAAAVLGIGGLALLSNQQPLSLTGELPPVLVDRAPQRGEEQGTGAPIVLVFDKPMDRASTEEALSITPAVPVAFEWEQNDTQLEIVPAGEGFAHDTTYEVKVATSALAANGKNLIQELLFKFKAVGFLDVVQSSPRVSIVSVSARVEAAAWSWLRRHDERGYSFVDATSFEVMREDRIREALAFDGDFSAAGFIEVRPT